MAYFLDFLNDILNVYSLLACILCLLWWHNQSSHSYWRRLNVKSLKPIPFFGNTAAHALRQATLHDTIDELYKELHDEPFGGFYQRHDPMFMVKDPKLVPAIVVKNFKNFHDRNDNIITILFNKNRKLNPISIHLTNTTGERWRVLRQKLTPIFSSSQLNLMHDQILYCSNLLIDRIEKEIADGGSVDIVVKQFVGKFAIDVIGTCIFGIECNSLTSSDKFIEMCKESLKPRFPAIVHAILSMISRRLLNLLNLRNMKKEVSEFFSNIIFDTINYRRQSGFVRNDALHLMLQLQNSHVDPKFDVQGNNTKILSNEKFDEIDITANSYMFFIAGFETTASTLSFCLYELAINQDIQMKLRSEVQQIQDKYKTLTYDSLKEMIYLDAVIAETLRKYPIIVFLNRKCTEDYVIPETKIRLAAGTKLIIPVWSIHHDSRYYPNPDVFDPERFIGENARTRPSGLYLPFGDGPRACIGKRFAETEMKVALAAIILKYNIRPCAKTEIPLTFDKSAKMLRPNKEIQINFSRIKCEAAFSFGRATLHDTIDRLYKQLDDEPFGGFYQKHDPLLMVKDPKLVSAVLITNFQHFHDRGQITSILSKNQKLNPLNTNLFSTTGERWRIMRRKLTPFFSSGQQKLMYDQINFCSKMLIERMEKHTDDGTGSTCMPTQNLFRKFMIDVIGTCAFGIECPSLTSNDTFPRMCKEAMTLRFPTIGRLILSLIGPRLFDSLNIRIMKKEASDFIVSMILDTINHRRQSGLVRKDILHSLLQFQNSHVDPKFAVEANNSVLLKEKFDEIDIAAHSFGFFFAGCETTPATLNFCLYELALNQDIQKKLRSEIQQIKDKHKILNYDSLKEMTYLDAVITETLRKYPIVVFIHRKCTEEYVIPETNVRIPAGTKIIVPAWSIHHDWRYYPNPEVFDPERFMGDNKRTRSSSLYLPFGDGPRSCSGQRFAQMVMKTALSAMILKYDVRPCAKTEVPLTFSKSSNVLRPNAEIQINLSRRIM